MASKETSLGRNSNIPWQRAKPRSKPLYAPHLPAWQVCSQIPKSCHVASYLPYTDGSAALSALSSDPAAHTSNNSYESPSLSLPSAYSLLPSFLWMIHVEVRRIKQYVISNAGNSFRLKPCSLQEAPCCLSYAETRGCRAIESFCRLLSCPLL